MAVDFEAPTAALFARLAAIPGVKYSSRELKSIDDTPPDVMPALMMTSGDIELYEPQTNLPGQSPPMFKLGLDVVLYVAQLDPAIATSVALNAILSGICNAVLGPTVGEPQVGIPQFPRGLPGARGTTLGGLCAWCRVSGKIIRAEGLVGNVAAASVPFEMVVTS